MAGPNVLWPEPQALRLAKLAADGLSASNIAAELNAEFGTSHSRNAVIGKIGRLKVPWNTTRVFMGNPGYVPVVAKPRRKRAVAMPKEWSAPKLRPARAVTEAVCASITPKHIRCVDLEPAHCRWPYGDRDITFCGHERLADHSYCESHWHLSRGDGTPSERAANRV